MILKLGDYEFSRDSRRLSRRGRPVALNPDALALLVLLLEKPGIMVTNEQIRRGLWPDLHAGVDRKVDATMAELRNAFGGQEFIEARPGIGYRFVGASMVRPTPARIRRWTLGRILFYLLAAIAIAAAAFWAFEKYGALAGL